jgi:hypothetical protein
MFSLEYLQCSVWSIYSVQFRVLYMIPMFSLYAIYKRENSPSVPFPLFATINQSIFPFPAPILRHVIPIREMIAIWQRQAREFNDVTMAPIFVLKSSVYFYMLVTTMDFLGFMPGCWNHRIHPEEARWNCSWWLHGMHNFQTIFTATVSSTWP